MKKLEPSQYSIILPLLEKVNFDKVFALAIIDKIQSGTVFVNNINSPKTAFISHYSSGFSLVCGQADNETFNNKLKELLLTESSNKPKQIRLVVYPDIWNKKLTNLLGNRCKDYSEIHNDKKLDQYEKLAKLKLLISKNVLRFERVRFRFNHQKFLHRLDFFNQLPQGFTLHRIDENIYPKISGRIIPSFSWDNIEDFLQRGIGYCLLKKDQVISTSFSSFISNNMIDVGIETDLNYRGLGLGLYPAAAMIQYCLNNDFEPIWGTNSDNIGSRKVANKLGYEENFNHSFYCSILK